MVTDPTTEAEQAVLGGLLADNKALFRLPELEPDDFGAELHQLLYRSISDAIADGRSVDALTVADLVPNDEAWRYAVNLSTTFPSSANIPAYAEIVRDHGRGRKLRSALSQTEDLLAAQGYGEAESFLLEKVLAVGRAMRPDVDLDEAMDAAAARTNKDGLSLTIPTLTEALNGLQPGRFYVLAARPGGYKSALALQIAVAAAAAGVGAGYISREMPHAELADRAKQMGIYRPSLPLRIDDTSASLDQISARIRQWKHQRSVGLVVVDYIQLLRASGETRQQQVGAITRALKGLAMELEIPIIGISQLNRASESENREPRMADLREAGDIEQDADVVIFIHRQPAADGPKWDRFFFLLAKNRGGQCRINPVPARVEGFRIMESG